MFFWGEKIPSLNMWWCMTRNNQSKFWVTHNRHHQIRRQLSLFLCNKYIIQSWAVFQFIRMLSISTFFKKNFHNKEEVLQIGSPSLPKPLYSNLSKDLGSTHSICQPNIQRDWCQDFPSLQINLIRWCQLADHEICLLVWGNGRHTFISMSLDEIRNSTFILAIRAYQFR